MTTAESHKFRSRHQFNPFRISSAMRHTLAAMNLAITRAVTTAENWAARRRQRRALLALGHSGLKDIGLSRADAHREAIKPFWRD